VNRPQVKAAVFTDPVHLDVKRHPGQMLRKPVAGLPTQVVNEKGDSHQESGAPICAELSARVRIPKYHSMNRSMAYLWLRRDWAEARVLSTDDRDCSSFGIVKLARRALANIKCCHVFSFYAATYAFGDSGASPSFLHLVAHNCPAAFRSAANEASDITSVKGLPLKGTAP
jgi:hypothetical protein